MYDSCCNMLVMKPNENYEVMCQVELQYFHSFGCESRAKYGDL